MAQILVLSTFNRNDSMSLLATKRSQRELAEKNCIVQGVVLGGQEIGPF